MTNHFGLLFDEGYESFDALTDAVWNPVSRATVAVSRPTEGEHVLDACCGAGASAIPAAAAVGLNGRVDAVDLSERLLSIGRSRTEGVPQLRFNYGDVTAWGGGPYDVVQCVLGLFFLPDMTNGGRALVKRLRPGGRCAITVWREGAIAPIPGTLAMAVTSEGGAPNMRPDRVNRPEGLAELLRSIGLRGVQIEEVSLAVRIDPRLAWAFVLGSALRGQLRGLDPHAVERVRLRFVAELDVDVVDTSILVGLGHQAG